ncbi:HupE / UreJ protein [Fontimonas thermophila]|uniref:HupE / UreJ protein n=1 Tax=Fontimonas thermophila TaxID=1076937 RepID=A0A1I2IA47_9GAMM|nr:HupE/UreJ family protein [Fontimonas thermophila]SFF39219.1 HupE / UreJ protein [Fontimonas thermophila]
MSGVLRSLLVLGAALALWAAPAAAHRPSDAFLTLALDGERVSGQLEIALRDVDVLVAADADGDRQLTWGELRASSPLLAAAVGTGVQLQADGRACTLAVRDLQVHARSDGRYAWLELAGQCPAAPRVLALEYRLLFDLDPTHRGLLRLAAGAQDWTAVFGPDSARREWSLGTASAGTAFRDYLVEGVRHIWIGIDHILFLLALLLPAVLVWRGAGWQPVTRLRPALFDVIATVTAFTLAHSITLTLAALDVLRLPGAAVEATIAASVTLAAVNNLRPLVWRRRWLLAFAFGLIHGFGFASVLGELGLPTGLRVLSLLAFNLGVELGQLAIVLVAVPLAYLLRASRFYRIGVLGLGSAAVAAIGALWCLQRLGIIGG